MEWLTGAGVILVCVPAGGGSGNDVKGYYGSYERGVIGLSC